jgi:hypothetical protein
MSKINVTIATNPAAQTRRSPATPNDFGPTTAAFFLNFDCETVDAYLTNAKSIIYGDTLHGVTQSVNL